ncbi:MAG TPA: IS630 family transposase [Planctomycetes bacterium]|nr:IS630 family transposase [Planctomycetota bacterium]
MAGIVPELRWSDKERLSRQVGRCTSARQRIRYLIIVNLVSGLSATDIVNVLQVGRSTVYDVAKRFRERGEVGLVDRREENGERKLDETYLAKLHEVVAASAQDYGWRRPTWPRELLAETMAWETGVRIHVSTMSTALKMISARQGRPKPTVGCPWSKRAKNKRLRELRRLVETLPEDEVAVYEDEIDIHLNPKIGPDWMVRGQQKGVLTPGKNVKRYLAGAIDSRTGELIWMEAEQKNTLLFINLLWELVQHYRDAKVIHVILDNYSIHSTQQVEVSLATAEGQRIQLHFLPPYCPDHNRIERLWRDLHANVTRNHRCAKMPELMIEVRYWLRKRNLKQLKTLSA